MFASQSGDLENSKPTGCSAKLLGRSEHGPEPGATAELVQNQRPHHGQPSGDVAHPPDASIVGYEQDVPRQPSQALPLPSPPFPPDSFPLLPPPPLPPTLPHPSLPPSWSRQSQCPATHGVVPVNSATQGKIEKMAVDLDTAIDLGMNDVKVGCIGNQKDACPFPGSVVTKSVSGQHELQPVPHVRSPNRTSVAAPHSEDTAPAAKMSVDNIIQKSTPPDVQEPDQTVGVPPRSIVVSNKRSKKDTATDMEILSRRRENKSTNARGIQNAKGPAQDRKVEKGAVENLLAAAYSLTQNDELGGRKASEPGKSFKESLAVPYDDSRTHTPSPGTAATRREDLKHSKHRTGNTPVSQKSQKSTHPCGDRLSKMASPLLPARSVQDPKTDASAGLLEELDLPISLSAPGGFQRNETQEVLQNLINIVSDFQKERKKLRTEFELLRKDVRRAKEPALVVLQAREDIEIRRKRGPDGEWFISVYEREGRSNNGRQPGDAPEAGDSKVGSLCRSDEAGCILQINIQSAKLAVNRSEKRSDLRPEPEPSAAIGRLSGNGIEDDPKVWNRKKRRVHESKGARPLPPDVRASKRRECPAVAAGKTPDSVAVENDEKRIVLAMPGELKSCGFPVIKRHGPRMSAIRNRSELVRGSDPEDSGSSNIGGNGNDTSEEHGGKRGGRSEVVAGEDIHGKKRRRSDAIDDRARANGPRDGGEGEANGELRKRSSRGERSRRRRDNWTSEENSEFLKIVQTNIGMEEMSLRRMLARKFAPRRTHEQCANHLRILRSLGRLPHATGEAIVGPTRLPSSDGNVESEDV